MKRREEIELAWFNKEVQSNHRYDEKSFKEAVEWADKTMLNKVCDWIQCMALDYITGDITDVKWQSMFADLRKYVENGDD